MGPSDSNPGALKVLVVDDEPVIADTMAQILTNNGYCADSLHSPIEAVEHASKRAIDLLITGVVMGDEMTGIDAAIDIIRMVPHCKVLLISGDVATSGLLSKAHEKGYDFEILPKPIHPTVILEKLRLMTGR